MPAYNHLDTAIVVFDRSGLQPTPPNRTPEQVLNAYTIPLLKMLPAGEEAGYVKGPSGGENVFPLPDGTYVRVGRVMYEDGYMYKIMNDVPNGGPQWVLEETGENPHLYYPYPYDGTEPEPGPDPELEERVRLLETENRIQAAQITELEVKVEANRKRMEDINDRFDRESEFLNMHKPTDQYYITVFGYKLTLKTDVRQATPPNE